MNMMAKRPVERPVQHHRWSDTFSTDQMTAWFRAADSDHRELLRAHGVCYRTSRHLSAPEPEQAEPEPELTPIVIGPDDRLGPKHVVRACAALATVPVNEFKAGGWCRNLVLWRAVAGHVMHVLFPHLSLREIGRYLNLDASLVGRYRKRVSTDVMAGGETFGEAIDRAERALGLR